MRSGRFAASYDFRGETHHANGTFNSREDARQWLADEQADIRRGRWTAPATREDAPVKHRRVPTLAGYAGSYASGEGWFGHAAHRPATEVTYERQWRKRIEPAFGSMRLDEITSQDVALWWHTMTKGGQRRCHDAAYSLLFTILKSAALDGLIGEVPRGVRGAGRPSRHRSVAPLTPAQVALVAAEVGRYRPGWAIGVLLGAWCALRSGEIRELRRRDIDLEHRVIHVTRAVSTGPGGVLHVGPPKTEAGVRDAPIPAGLVEPLRAHLRDHTGRFPSSLLVCMPDGGGVKAAAWDKTMRRAFKVCGLQGYWFHDSRRTALTSLAVAGATLRELQAVAGHSTPAMAMRYQEVAQSHLDEVMGRVSDMMAGAG